MANIIDIYNLLPEEINEAIKRLTDALEIVKHRKILTQNLLIKRDQILNVLDVILKI